MAVALPPLYRNNVAATLNAGVGPSETILVLGSGQGVRFPTPTAGQYFWVTVVRIATGVYEIMRCTARSGDSLTVQRAQESTTAVSFVTGDLVEMRATAGMMAAMDWRTLAGQADGVATLTVGGFIPDAQIPSFIVRNAQLVTALAGKENTLGFTPVQQGTGAGQTTNLVKIGWTGAKLACTIDITDMGPIAFESFTNATYVPLSSKGAASGVAPLDAGNLIPIVHIPALPYLPANGAINRTGNVVNEGDLQLVRPGALNTGYVFTGNTGRYFGYDGSAYQIPGADVVVQDLVVTSDERLKDRLTKRPINAYLADAIDYYDWQWKSDGTPGYGVVAQHVQAVAPHLVREHDGMLAVDKAGLALELALSLRARIHELENRA